jgi:hypothetical protein
VIATLVVITAIWIAFVGISDLVLAIFPEDRAPLFFVAYGAFVVHVLMAVGVVIGPLELRHADDFSRSVYVDPRLGTGLVAETAKLLDLPDVRAFARSGRAKAWLLVFCSLALEGLALAKTFFICPPGITIRRSWPIWLRCSGCRKAPGRSQIGYTFSRHTLQAPPQRGS